MQTMTSDTPVAAIPSPLRVSRNFFYSVFIVTITLACYVREASPSASPLAELVDAVVQHKVAWICIAIAIWHITRADPQPLTFRDLIAASPALVLAPTTWSSWPWAGLSLSLMLISRGVGNPAVRCGILMVLALALHQALIPILGDLFGDMLLRIDAYIAGAIAQLTISDLSSSGTALRSGSGHTVVVVWGCSSFSHVGEAMLFCWALTSLLTDRRGSHASRTLALCIGFTALGTVLINTLRLAFMAADPDIYQYVHDGAGAALFRAATLAVSAASASTYFFICVYRN